MKALGTFAALLLLLGQVLLSAPASAEDVDLELVLAVDGSGSVNEREFGLQLGGIAAAFRSPRIQRAIALGPLRKIAVALMVWSDAAFPKVRTKWFVIDGPESAETFAHVVETFYPRTGRPKGQGGGGTGIGSGVAFALDMLKDNSIAGTRQIIDVSGDGIETEPWYNKAVTMPQAKLMAEALQVTINGLAILADFPRLDEYYRDHVIHGSGAFVMKAADFVDFEEAIKEKLYREILVVIGALDPETKYRPATKGRDLIYIPTARKSAQVSDGGASDG